MGFLQEFQHFQIIAINIEIFGDVEVYAFLTAGVQRLIDPAVEFLVRSRKLIALLIAIITVRATSCLSIARTPSPFSLIVSITVLESIIANFLKFSSTLFAVHILSLFIVFVIRIVRCK